MFSILPPPLHSSAALIPNQMDPTETLKLSSVPGPLNYMT